MTEERPVEAEVEIVPADGPTPAQEVAKHDAAQGHKYLMHFPAHPARAGDPHYADFHAFHRKFHDTATCFIGDRVGVDHCSEGPLELHHAHIEFSLQNGVDLKALEVDYPGIGNPDEVGAWVESAANLRWLCAYHHRGAAGAHTAAHADWEASQYVRGLIDTVQKEENNG